jgi:hypothetical protein
MRRFRARARSGNQSKHVMGVADDIVGATPPRPGSTCIPPTANGLACSSRRTNEPSPLEIELEDASKLREMMQLVYAQGAEKVQAGEKVAMADRRLYNEAAEYLHARSRCGAISITPWIHARCAAKTSAKAPARLQALPQQHRRHRSRPSSANSRERRKRSQASGRNAGRSTQGARED